MRLTSSWPWPLICCCGERSRRAPERSAARGRPPSTQATSRSWPCDSSGRLAITFSGRSTRSPQVVGPGTGARRPPAAARMARRAGRNHHLCPATPAGSPGRPNWRRRGGRSGGDNLRGSRCSVPECEPGRLAPGRADAEADPWATEALASARRPRLRPPLLRVHPPPHQSVALLGAPRPGCRLGAK